VNVRLFENPAAPSILVASLGVVQMVAVAARPAWFRPLSVLFALYALAVLYLTA
jgi:hypothetical protein